jgi:hypothetical protein
VAHVQRPLAELLPEFAAPGGAWSTFDDQCRYADWALDEDADLSRTVGWQREDATTWMNGDVRAPGVVIVRAEGVTAVVHALAQTPSAADRIDRVVIVRELHDRLGPSNSG